MANFTKKEITKKSENISEWYNDVVLKAQLADYGPAKGTMVFMPYGYAVWENVQKVMDAMFKSYGVQNAYFPMFIPYSLLEKEKEHMKGFSPELAVVTHGGGEKLQEPLVVRPTSETIMYVMYAKWIQSWRDLPMLINQWNNAVRWEKRTYLFLRTTEFLWQEGHTVHETREDSLRMQETALDWYKSTYEDYYAIPTVTGIKSRTETFAGADSTYTVEVLMPDGKALQGATSHNLGQNFSKAFDITFQNRKGENDFVWQTSWGFSTRSLGGLFLTHGDDQGLVLPPKIAPYQVVILPIFMGKLDDEQKEKIRTVSKAIYQSLDRSGVRSLIEKNAEVESIGRLRNEWELKGAPVRIELGNQEIEKGEVTLVRRDTLEKIVVKQSELVPVIQKLLDEIQQGLYNKAKKFLEDNTHVVNSYEEFKKIMSTTRGFIKALWCENADCETKIKEETKASTRCLEFSAKNGLNYAPEEEDGVCIYCGKPAKHRWVFAQAY